MKNVSPGTVFFERLLKARWLVLSLALVAIAVTGRLVPEIERDTSSDAFMQADEPALLYKEKMEEVFGLTDPLVIAVVNHGENGIFEPETLALVAELTRAVERVKEIDPDRVTSLATENIISGTAEGIVTEGFLDRDTESFTAPLGTHKRADEIRLAVEDFPLLQGSLVARDGTATIIAAELLHEDLSTPVYEAFLAIVSAVEIPMNALI